VHEGDAPESAIEGAHRAGLMVPCEFRLAAPDQALCARASATRRRTMLETCLLLNEPGRGPMGKQSRHPRAVLAVPSPGERMVTRDLTDHDLLGENDDQ
jgi:hypothetical protein